MQIPRFFVLQTLLTLVCLNIASANSNDLTGRDIMDEISTRHDSSVEMEVQTMTLDDNKGTTQVRELRQFGAKQDSGLYKYLLAFDNPRGIKGVALLTWENPGGDDDQWTFLPAMGKKLKRIASGGRKNLFMGTDFAFEDLMSEEKDNFRYERLPDEQLVAGGPLSYVVDAYPDNDSLVTGYEKRRIYITQDTFVIQQIDYHQKRTGKLIKQLVASDLVNVEGDLWRANTRQMKSLTKNHQTTIKTTSRSFSADDVPDAVFTHRYITSMRHSR